MTAEEFAKQLKETTSNPEEMWLYAAAVIFFPLALAMLLWRGLNKGFDAMWAQAISNGREQMRYDNMIKEQQDRHMQKMQMEYQVYLAQREKRLQAYEKKIKASTPPETSVPALDAPAP
jgi:hypothetical protein